MKNSPVNISAYVDLQNSELSSLDAVEKGIVHIIAASIATDTDVLTFLRKLYGKLEMGNMRLCNSYLLQKGADKFYNPNKKSQFESYKTVSYSREKNWKRCFPFCR